MTRVALELSDESLADLEVVVAELGAASRSEAIRRALATMRAVLQARDGGRVVVLRPGQPTAEFILP